jgi:hypothetical protein
MSIKGLSEKFIENLFEELVSQQDQRLLNLARKQIPYLTSDDILQPNDFPQLERDPEFRYEEGVKEGILTAQMAWRAASRERESH